MLKDNVLLFNNHNKDVKEYTRTDTLILWPKEKESLSQVKKEPEFNYEIEGHNPYWKLIDRYNFDNESMTQRVNSQPVFMNFEDYAEIDKNLRLARNVFMQESCSPGTGVIQKSLAQTTHIDTNKLEKFKISARVKFGTAERRNKQIKKQEARGGSPYQRYDYLS